MNQTEQKERSTLEAKNHVAICFILYRMLSSAFLTMPHPMSLQDTQWKVNMLI